MSKKLRIYLYPAASKRLLVKGMQVNPQLRGDGIGHNLDRPIQPQHIDCSRCCRAIARVVKASDRVSTWKSSPKTSSMYYAQATNGKQRHASMV